MPETRIIIYQDKSGKAPLIKWLKGVPEKVQNKCYVYIERLEQEGHALRRPVAEHLGDGIYELRPTHKHVQYRILYTFVGQNVVLLTHGLVKEREMPASEIARAMEYKRRYEANPQLHTYFIEE